VIDGKVEASEWAGAAMTPRMLSSTEDHLSEMRQKFYWAVTDDGLYLAYQIQRPPAAIAPAAYNVEHDTTFGPTDDVLEFWLDAINDLKRPVDNYRDFYFIWNLFGTKYDRMDRDGPDTRWDPNWQVVSRVVPDFGWEGEIYIPFKDLLDTVPPKTGDEWRGCLVSNQRTPFPHLLYSAWSMQWSANEDFMRMLFSGISNPFVRVLESGMDNETRKGGAVFEIVNPGAEPQKVPMKLRLYRRKDEAKSPLSYLRAFEQTRDKGGSSDAGKAAAGMLQ